MHTQNANECYNGQVWRRCPKSLSTSKTIVDTAVAMASLDFNYGPTGYSKILEELDISSGITLDIIYYNLLESVPQMLLVIVPLDIKS